MRGFKNTELESGISHILGNFETERLYVITEGYFGGSIRHGDSLSLKFRKIVSFSNNHRLCDDCNCMWSWVAQNDLHLFRPPTLLRQTYFWVWIITSVYFFRPLQFWKSQLISSVVLFDIGSALDAWVSSDTLKLWLSVMQAVASMLVHSSSVCDNHRNSNNRNDRMT